MTSNALARAPMRVAAVLVTLIGILAPTMAGATVASENARIDLRVLVISPDGTDQGLGAWKAALDRSGVPYDVFIATDEPPLTADRLSDGVDHARYQAVLLSEGDLVYCEPSVGCFEAFTPEEWEVLDAYQAEFGIRRVSGNTFPTPEHGLIVAPSGGDMSGDRTNLTAAGLAAFPALAGPVDLGVGTYGYVADPDPSAVLFNRAGRPFAGLVADPSPVLTAPSWIVYFGVPDVAEACEAVEWIGGTVLAVTGARSAGQAALVADPGGAVFGLSRL